MPHKKLWEYHVSDLSEKFEYSNLNLAPEERFQIGNTREIPTVVIFGWAGSLDKYLKVYSKLYEDRGLRTIRFIVPTKHLFLNSNKVLKMGEEMVSLWVRQKFKDTPMVIHAFSNGGSFQYEVFMRALKQTPHHTQVIGMIFDSCPAKRNWFALYRAFKVSVDAEYFKVPIAAALTIYAVIKRSLEMFYAQTLGRDCIQMNPHENLKNEKCRWPQHFIYSKLDNLVSYEQVEEFVHHRKALGVDVTVKRYDNSGHVQHYPKNKASYIRSVVKFVNKCLRR